MSCATASTSGPFRKREGSRASQYAVFDKPALNPPPAEPFDLSCAVPRTTTIDYHIVFDANFAACLYNLVQELVGRALNAHDR